MSIIRPTGRQQGATPVEDLRAFGSDLHDLCAGPSRFAGHTRTLEIVGQDTAHGPRK